MDTFFQNTRVVFGSGAEVYEADVGVVGGLITAVGPRLPADERRCRHQGVWVNGVEVISGNAIGETSLPGRLIREFDA